MTTGVIKNWGEFQHYRNRRPPWIKLHRDLLDNIDFTRLPLASKALAPLLWLLASESDDGSVCLDTEFLSFRLRWQDVDIECGVKGLIDKKFISVASGVLAECLHDASAEERRGETEGEGEKPASSKPVKKSKRSLPSDFAVSDAVQAWAIGKGFSRLDEHLEAFKLKAIAKDYQYVDWDSAFMEAVRNDWARLGPTNVTPIRKTRKELGA